MGESILVLGVDDSFSPGLEWDVGAPEAIALDGGGELLVPLSFPCCCRLQVGRRVPWQSQLDEHMFFLVQLVKFLMPIFPMPNRRAQKSRTNNNTNAKWSPLLSHFRKLYFANVNQEVILE